MKKKKVIRALALIMAATSVTTGTIPVFATGTGVETEIATSGTNGDVSFELDIKDSFNLAIPKSIILTKNADGDYDADYNIKMVGCDISPTKKVTVSSSENITVARKDSNDTVIATNDMDKNSDNIQNKISFTDKVKDVTYTGYMNAGALTSGSWQAQTTFTVALEDKQTQAVTKEAGLYDADGNMLCALTKEQVEMDYNDDNVLPQTLGIDSTRVAEAVIPEGITRIGGCAFSDCTSLTSVTIPDGVTTIAGNTFAGCASLTSVTIPDGVTIIGERAFVGCASLTSVTIPDGVTSIEDCTFAGCASLTSVTIPDSVTYIGNNAFSDCTSLTSVIIPDSVKKIENWVFYKCTSLTSVTIPDGVKSIGEDAFYECTSLTSVTIPDSVTYIVANAFYNVPHIYYNGTATGQPWGAKTIN